MCGIAGSTRTILGKAPAKILHAMNQAMLHRGPNMGEIYFDQDMGLAHRRLSIIDLSEDGRQPMQSADGRFTIVFNGEIYNFQELKKELEDKGCRFRTRTDTEVLLQAYITFGPASLDKINGMFAYAIWDKQEKQLFAARDRIGKKPLHYYHHRGEFAFASEIKSILATGIRPTIDATAFIDYLHYLFVPHPKTIYHEIRKLPPGHYLLFHNGSLQIREYWDIDFSSPVVGRSETDLSEELFEITRKAVRARLLSDVPLGAFLSGGIDSSGIVALMSRETEKPVTTCTIGFHDKALNEAEDAKKFAMSLKADHHEHYVRDEPAQVIKKLVWHCDEPFADSSMVPTYYVSKMARQNVTVALSGDGGDENFAGYEKYRIDQLENRVRAKLPSPLLRAFSFITGQFPSWTICKKITSLCSSALLSPAYGFFITNSFITRSQLQTLLAPELRQAHCEYDPGEALVNYYSKANGRDHLAKILYTDLKMLLPGDFLVKVDRMSMANSLEVRSPLLDHRLIEFAASLPSNLKLRYGNKKYILKKSFSRILPEAILTRKKHGFESPIANWFRHELKTMAATAFFKHNALASFFDIKQLRMIWEQHQSGNYNHGTLLWTIFVFSLWLELFNNGFLPETFDTMPHHV